MDGERFKKTLEALLKTDSRLIDQNQELNLAIVKALADKMDEALIEQLLSNKETKKKFFLEIKNVLVFKQNEFKFFLDENKIDNSYTAFENKIGLSSNNSLLKENSDVVLNFPYKDCVLEGGQSTEEGADEFYNYNEKEDTYDLKSTPRKEIFFNEILAKDEIDRLLEPKAFCNIKKHTVKGEEKLESFRDKDGNISDNLIIKGNNLLALHSLKKEFTGKIKLIYIDPPYNTGNDSFSYNDNFSHSTWLVFMKNRLEIAKELLTDDGLIFVQMDSSRNSGIGSSELPYLNILLDEIFERKNFIGHLHWKKKKQPSFLSRIAGIVESILIYAKNEKFVDKLSIDSISDSNKPIINASNNYSIINFKSGIRVKRNIELIKKGKYISRSMVVEYLDDVIVKKNRTINSVKVKAQFRTSQINIDKFIDDDLLYITSNLGLRRDVTEEEKGKKKAITDLLLDWGQNQDADNEIKKIFGLTKNNKFSNPKPELLLYNLISSCTSEGDIILDYHLGSGTTCAVAHKMNRQYIGIEQIDSVFNDVTKKRMQKVVESEKGGISNLINWQGGGSFISIELKKWNNEAIEKITECKSLDGLEKLLDDLSEKYFLNYNVKFKEFREKIIKEENFRKLPFEKQQEMFAKMLDLNQLYVNASEMEDKKYGLSKEDITLTKNFYNLK